MRLVLDTNVVVSGGAHVLDLKLFQGIEIIISANVLERLAGSH